MKIWLVMSGEPLPIYGDRPHRVGILSDMLTQKGHDVTWWTTTFDHQDKAYLHKCNTIVNIQKNFNFSFLHSSVTYKKNVSFRRMLNHFQVSKQFINVAEATEKPDVIFCAYPTIDLAYEATKFAQKYGVPVVVDVRDLWPDIFVEPFPSILQPLGKRILLSYFNKARYVFSNCSAVTAVSQKYLEWTRGYTEQPLNELDQVFPLGYKKPTQGYDLSASRERMEKLGVSSSKLIIWFVGTFGQTYELSVVIEAAKKLEYVDDIQFVFTGDGEKSNEWRALAKTSRNIVFTGWVGKEDIAYLSTVATIGLMAYRKGAPQGLPNKIFEYLASGLPILSSLETETMDLLREHNVGLSYDANSSDDLYKKLTTLIKEKERLETMSSNAQALFDEYYSSDIIYSRLINYLELIVKRVK